MRSWSTTCEHAFKYCDRIVIEKAIKGRELEIGVRGTIDNLMVSNPGEIVLKDGTFYSYDEKYSENSQTATIFPAKLDELTTTTLNETAVRACRLLALEGLIRVDFFLAEDGSLY